MLRHHYRRHTACRWTVHLGWLTPPPEGATEAGKYYGTWLRHNNKTTTSPAARPAFRNNYGSAVAPGAASTNLISAAVPRADRRRAAAATVQRKDEIKHSCSVKSLTETFDPAPYVTAATAIFTNSDV